MKCWTACSASARSASGACAAGRQQAAIAGRVKDAVVHVGLVQMRDAEHLVRSGRRFWHRLLRQRVGALERRRAPAASVRSRHGAAERDVPFHDLVRRELAAPGDRVGASGSSTARSSTRSIDSLRRAQMRRGSWFQSSGLGMPSRAVFDSLKPSTLTVGLTLPTAATAAISRAPIARSGVVASVPGAGRCRMANPVGTRMTRSPVPASAPPARRAVRARSAPVSIGPMRPPVHGGGIDRLAHAPAPRSRRRASPVPPRAARAASVLTTMMRKVTLGRLRLRNSSILRRGGEDGEGAQQRAKGSDHHLWNARAGQGARRYHSAASTYRPFRARRQGRSADRFTSRVIQPRGSGCETRTAAPG